MIGVLLITHGTYGESLVQNVCHVLNRRPAQIAQLGVAAQDDPFDLLPIARRMIERVNTGDGVLLMTDIWGASPSNLAIKLLDPGRVEGVAGVSLPMLLRALTYREKGLEVMSAKAVSGARDGALNMTKDT